MSIDLAGSPYSLEASGRGVLHDIDELEGHVANLRSSGRLTTATLRAYFGDKRFEQIAESNALEGSTLNVGETQLAVLRGVTITGHDPAYSRDAVSLAHALDHLSELARNERPTDIEQLLEIHKLILGDRPGAGQFRSESVIIAGSAHRPPRTWQEVIAGMKAWEKWSIANPGLPGILRGVVLHTWLTHVHPFVDGNGRTARAILNLELIRSGCPSVIIRRTDRERYLDALAESDAGGDLGSIAGLVMDRAGDALRDLERAASRQQGYDQVATQLRAQQERQLAIWNDTVKLLFSLIEEAAEQAFGPVGSVRTRWYDDQLPLDDFVSLSQGDAAGSAWLFRIGVYVPAVGVIEYLAWTGFRSETIQRIGQIGPGPSILWSVRDASGYRPWIRKDELSPGGAELTLQLPNIDRWIVRDAADVVERLSPSTLVSRVIRSMSTAIGMSPEGS